MLNVLHEQTVKMMQDEIDMKLFKQNKWEVWWNNLSPTTKTYIKNQPLWHDKDLFKVMLFGFVMGVILGLSF